MSYCFDPDKMETLRSVVKEIQRSLGGGIMKIKDMQTLPEFFGVYQGDHIWIEGNLFVVEGNRLRSDFDYLSAKIDSQALVGCLTGQLEWSRNDPMVDDGFGCCHKCGYEFNSELINEYEIEHCPKCGRKIEETIEEIIVMGMTAEEENILREIAAWFPDWERITLERETIAIQKSWSGVTTSAFCVKKAGSKAYEVLAPILEKYGEINLDEYRESN